MEAVAGGLKSRRVWIWAAGAVFFPIASAFSFFIYIGQRMAVGALISLPGREADVFAAQRGVMRWLLVFLVCQIGSATLMALALPPDLSDSLWMRSIIRFLFAAVLSVLLSVFAGIVLFLILTALRRPGF